MTKENSYPIRELEQVVDYMYSHLTPRYTRKIAAYVLERKKSLTDEELYSILDGVGEDDDILQLQKLLAVINGFMDVEEHFVNIINEHSDAKVVRIARSCLNEATCSMVNAISRVWLPFNCSPLRAIRERQNFTADEYRDLVRREYIRVLVDPMGG